MTNLAQIEICTLAWRLLDEEIKVFNSAFLEVAGIKLIYAKDRTILIRFLSREKKPLFLKLSKIITEKDLQKIDFTEGSLDQLKIRIILRKYLSKVVFKFGYLKLWELLKILNENPVGFFRFIRAR